MKFKQYLKWVSEHIPPESDSPTDIVQSVTCLIASRLSILGRLPIACGYGDNLDMDIVQAGLLAGLEKIGDYDRTLGTSMRQFLYPTIAGAMQSYAWERENRIGDSRPRIWPEIMDAEDSGWIGDPSNDVDDETPVGPLEERLIDSDSPESLMVQEEESKTALAAIGAAVAGLGTDDMALLLKDAQIGYNAAKRQAWADEIGVTLGALSMRLSRLRKVAREIALKNQGVM